jgi:hypothetical protein
MANSFITLVMAWIAIGLVWAVFYDPLNNTLPAQYPGGPVNSPGTWSILLWIWNCSALLMGLTMAFSAGKPAKNQYGPSIVPAVLSACELLVLMTSLIFLWLVLFTPINITIPGTFNAWAESINPAYSAPTYLLDIYNSCTVFLMIGFCIAGIGRST